MKNKEEMLIMAAILKHGCILPCGGRLELKECFIRVLDRLIFWYTTQDGSTHIEQMSVFE